MGYLCIKNIDYNFINISYYKNCIFNIKYKTPYITLYGITLKINYIDYEIRNNFIYFKINQFDYKIINDLNEYFKNKINKYKSFTFSTDENYYLKIYNSGTKFDKSKANNNSFYMWISKIKNKNYINYPIIYIL